MVNRKSSKRKIERNFRTSKSECFEGPLGKVLRMSWGCPESTSLEPPLKLRLGRLLDVILGLPQDVRSGRPRDVRLGRPQDGQIRPLEDVLETLKGDVLGTSGDQYLPAETHLIKGAQFLYATLVFAFPPVAVIFPVTRIYASEQSQRFDLMTFVSNLIVVPFSSPVPYCELFWSLIMYHFLVANLEDSLSEPVNKFTIF